MTSKSTSVATLLLLEICVTVATAYQHHSEAKWEVSAAYFGTAVGYLLARLVVWLPLATLLLLGLKLYHRPLAIGQLALAALFLEVVTTLGSILLRQKQPTYGIYFGSFATYLGARVVLWVPLAYGSLLVLTRRPSVGPRP